MSLGIGDVLRMEDSGAVLEAVNAMLPTVLGYPMSIAPTEGGGCVALWGVLKIEYFPPSGTQVAHVVNGDDTWLVTDVPGIWDALLHELRSQVSVGVTEVIATQLAEIEAPICAAHEAAEAVRIADIYTERDLDAADDLVNATFYPPPPPP